MGDPRPGTPAPAAPVKLLAAVLWAERDGLDAALSGLERAWGPPDETGPDRLFDATDYYEPEMGKPLYRRLASFTDLVAPERLVEAKLGACALEERLRRPGGARTVNVDMGYLDHHKLVLASIKSQGQKVPLGRGVYADLVLRWEHGGFRPFPWTFPDFRDGRYGPELTRMRRRYLEQLRELRTRAPEPPPGAPASSSRP